MKNQGHEGLAQAFAQNIIATLEHQGIYKPHPDALQDYVQRWLTHNYYTKHERSRRAVTKRTLQIISKEIERNEQ